MNSPQFEFLSQALLREIREEIRVGIEVDSVATYEVCQDALEAFFAN